MALDERLDRHLEAEVGGRGARVGQRADQRVEATLAPGDLRPGWHLRPIDLHHLGGPVAGALGGALGPWPDPCHALSDQVDRARVAVIVAKQLGHPRRLDIRPVLDQLADHPLERIEHRARRLTAIARRLAALGQPLDRSRIDPEPLRDLSSRDGIGLQRPHPCPFHRAAHLLTGLLRLDLIEPRVSPASVATEVAHFSVPRGGAVLGSWCQLDGLRSADLDLLRLASETMGISDGGRHEVSDPTLMICYLPVPRSSARTQPRGRSRRRRRLNRQDSLRELSVGPLELEGAP